MVCHCPSHSTGRGVMTSIGEMSPAMMQRLQTPRPKALPALKACDFVDIRIVHEGGYTRSILTSTQDEHDAQQNYNALNAMSCAWPHPFCFFRTALMTSFHSSLDELFLCCLLRKLQYLLSQLIVCKRHCNNADIRCLLLE